MRGHLDSEAMVDQFGDHWFKVLPQTSELHDGV